MSNKISLESFEEIYNRTYKNVLKYIVIHCKNMEDVNDIIQDTYTEFYKKLKKSNKFKIEDEQSFIIGISKNIMKKYYRLKYRDENNIIDIENIEIEANIDLELQFITKENVDKVWKNLQNKDAKIIKIFYLHYVLDMKLTDIAIKLKLTESSVKNCIYRTIKELRGNIKKESDENV